MAVANGLVINVEMVKKLIINRLCFVIANTQVKRLISIRPCRKTDQSGLDAASTRGAIKCAMTAYCSSRCKPEESSLRWIDNAVFV
jgi:hypothetical protein